MCEIGKRCDIDCVVLLQVCSGLKAKTKLAESFQIGLGFIFQSWLIIRLYCYIFSFLRAFSYNWILFISLITADMDDGAQQLDGSADVSTAFWVGEDRRDN